MTDRLQMNLMFNIAAFRIFRAKKFPARRQVVKKRAHLDLSSRGFATVTDDIDLATIDNDFGSCNGVGLSSSQAKSRDTGDAWQCFAAKSQCGHRMKIRSRSNLAGGMTL